MRGFYSILVVILIFPLVSVLWVPASDADPDEIFVLGNQAYKEDHFLEAVRYYEELVKLGYRNGHIYYNLGNSYFKLEQLGKAILNYERARIMIPRDADLNFNIKYAKDQIQDALPEEQNFFDMVFFYTKTLTLNELFLGFAVLNLVFWGILFIRLFSRKEWIYYVMIISLIFWLIGGTSFGWKYFRQKTDNRVVVLIKEANILAGPDTGYTVLFKLHEGAIIRHERSEDGWSLISLSDEKRGWTRTDALGKIMDTDRSF